MSIGSIKNDLELAREAVEAVLKDGTLELERFSSVQRSSKDLYTKEEALAESTFQLGRMGVFLEGFRDQLEAHDEELPTQVLEAIQDGFRKVTKALEVGEIGHPSVLTRPKAWQSVVHKMRAATFIEDIEALTNVVDGAIELVEEAERLGIDATDVVQYSPELLEPFEFSLPNESAASLAYGRHFEL